MPENSNYDSHGKKWYSLLKKLLEKKVFGVLSTIHALTGAPHGSVIWLDYDGDYLLFNSITDRQKYRNIKVDPRISIVVMDPDNPYRYVEVRGKVEDITTRGADEFIDKLAKKYLGIDCYPYHRPGVTRVIYRVKPIHLSGYDK